MKFSETIESLAKEIAEKAFKYVYEGKTLREWVETIKDYERNKWIPCSERLPEDRKEKMVYLSSDRISIAIYNEHRLPHSGCAIGWGYRVPDGYIDFETEEVIAWMPLPEPYKENICVNTDCPFNAKEGVCGAAEECAGYTRKE